MPEVQYKAVTAGTLAPRACYSACVSEPGTPVDYSSSPDGARTPGREPQPVKRTLSYLDLAVPSRAAESTAASGGQDTPDSRGGSVAALLARTWAHDLSADAGRNRTSRTDSAVTSSNVTSGSPDSAPAKVAIVVKVESTTDQPLRLLPLTSDERTGSGLLEASAFERAAVRKQNRAAHQRQSQDRFNGATRTAASEALRCAFPARHS
ncbi:hypothetical protein MRX96_014784 [Rhipicephalus microplus]